MTHFLSLNPEKNKSLEILDDGARSTSCGKRGRLVPAASAMGVGCLRYLRALQIRELQKPLALRWRKKPRTF